MSSISANRMNLLLRKERMRVAGDGARLLQSKREALLREFLALADNVLSARNTLEDRCRDATNTLNLALAREGNLSLRSAGMAALRQLDIEMTERRVWGIPVPEIQHRHLVRSPEARGYSLTGTGLQIDETATAFEKVLEQAMLSAMEEVRLRKIGGEIQRTSRRVNALEQILIPSLGREVHRILRALEERAREDVFRLKRLKAKKSRRPGEGFARINT
jgi:V/A-type H+-transporting ATPase subunit D